MAKLTDRLIGSLKVPAGKKDRIVFDSETKGLGVRVTKAGSRVFIVQWTDPATKEKQRLALGTWGKGTIPNARKAATAILGDVARGIDPIADRERQKQEAAAERAEAALSVDALITKWADGHLATKRPKYAREAKRALRYAFAKHLKRPASRLTRAHVRNVLDGLVERGNGPMALRTAAYGRAAYNWAIGKEHVSGNPFAALKLSAEEKSRERVLADSELVEIWEAAIELGYPFGHWTRFAMLTLQRGRQEIAAMRRGEVSADGRTWEIPGSRMKNRQAHLVHLSAPARELLQSIEPFPGSDLVFTTGGKVPINGFSKPKAALDKIIVDGRAERAKASGTKPASLTPWTFHDFRRTGASKLAEWEFDTVAIDRLLAHRPTRLRGVANVYQKAELLKVRERALDAWGAFVARLPMQGATVLPFKAGA